MSKILERMNIIQNTGEWWSIPWWEDGKYYTKRGVSKEEAQRAFSELKDIFNAKWILRYAKYSNTVPTNEELSKCHPMFLSLSAEGLSIFLYLSSLGSDLYNLRQARLLDKRLIDRLKNKENFTGAEFEVKILAYFFRNGWAVKPDPPSGKGNKKCDLRVSKTFGKSTEEVFIEVTKPEDFCYENKKRIIYGQLAMMDCLRSDDEERINNFWREWNKGKYNLSEGAEIKKLIPKIEEKASQLPVGAPGLIIIYTPMSLNPKSSQKIFEDAINKLFKKMTHVSAIILFEGYNIVEYGIYYQTTVFLNPMARTDISNSEIKKAIENFKG